MIEKLYGRDKLRWLVISNKLNEIIDAINKIEESIKEEDINNDEDMQSVQEEDTKK